MQKPESLHFKIKATLIKDFEKKVAKIYFRKWDNKPNFVKAIFRGLFHDY